MKKCLIIRFSSFGDIVQNMGILPSLHLNEFATHWLTKKEFADVVALSPSVHKVWSFDKKQGALSLIWTCFSLRKEGYTHIYDAHKNIKSMICSLILCFPTPHFSRPKYIRRSKERWKRILLFHFGVNRFPTPFRGIASYTRPIREWITGNGSANPIQQWDFRRLIPQERRKSLDTFGNKIILAPSAAWPMKRWPLDHWIELIKLWPQGDFVLLGGPNDGFCERIAEGRANVTSLIGRLSLIESCYLVSQARLVISADTGLIHVADLLGTKGLCLMGPTAFGFPTGKHIGLVEVPLECRPCSKDGRGKCSQDVYQKCMVDIKPENVLKNI